MTENLLTARNGQIGHIQLDRPKALNALTTEMIVALHKALDDFAEDSAVSAVVLTSTAKHFCAGGDIKAVRQSVLDGTSDGFEFFDLEYSMNAAIANFAKPYVALLHGATMGGGIGVSVHGSHRIVSETLMASMPETAIGFIPDVGASYALPRFTGGVPMAIYLGASGTRLNAADALYLGLGTHLIDDADREQFVATAAAEGIDAAIAKHCKEPAAAGESRLAPHAAEIEDVFSRETVDEMVARLGEIENEGGAAAAWAKETLGQLRDHSPTSIVATVELMRHNAKAASVEDALAAELRLGQWITREPDFVEGVRAVLVDKSRDAAWSPQAPADVDVAAIRAALSGGA